MAVLIDVDNLSDVPFTTDDFVMYNVSFTETKMCDWRHYAVMLAHLDCVLHHFYLTD